MSGHADHDPRLDGLTAFVMDVSCFSGKLEGYLRYKEIPYERVEVGWQRVVRELGRETGEARVPALRLADGTRLTDSTPIIEWLWRPALHYRWSFAPDRRLLGERIAREALFDVPGPVRLKAMQVRRDRAPGVYEWVARV